DRVEYLQSGFCLAVAKCEDLYLLAFERARLDDTDIADLKQRPAWLFHLHVETGGGLGDLANNVVRDRLANTADRDGARYHAAACLVADVVGLVARRQPVVHEQVRWEERLELVALALPP